MMPHKEMLSLFNAVYVEDVPEDTNSATVVDVAAMAFEYRYVLSLDLALALDKMTPLQRGTVFKRLGAALNENVKGMADSVSPLYRAFPNHTLLPFQTRMALWLLSHVGFRLAQSEWLYGADPMTGFQNDWNGADVALDAEFTVRFKDEAGNRRRKVRVLRASDSAFVADKLKAMLSNLTPFSAMEQRFVRWVLAEGMVSSDTIASVKFREKLPALYSLVDEATYASYCNSVTDVLRLAVALTGPVTKRVKGYSWSRTLDKTVTVEPDLSLKTLPRFSLKTAQAKSLMRILEAILMRGNTDHETDFLRHDEVWKRFAEHIRIRQYELRAPLAYASLVDLRLGWMKSWESQFYAASPEEKVAMAKQRPGVLVRRLTELNRALGPKNALLTTAAATAFETVDPMKLLQLRTHVARTAGKRKRFHQLPDGTILKSERVPDTFDPAILSSLEKALEARLTGTLPFNKEVPESVYNMFIPSGNRAMSDTDTRTSRGDRVRLSFEDTDTIRFFLHWHESCDVDISAIFYNEDLDWVNECTFYNLRNGDYAKHSGDILDGSRGAAEYIDINVAKAKKAGARYVMMNANVFRGLTFNSFPCHVGVMIRDGQTGRHFEISTVETKLSLDSDARNTSPAVLDLYTGDMIYVDLYGHWGMHGSARSHADELKDILRYFVNYSDYRASFGDLIAFAGSDDPNAPVATPDLVREKQDEILALVSAL